MKIKRKIAVLSVALATIFASGYSVTNVHASNPREYQESYALYNKEDQTTSIQDAIESMEPYTKKVFLEDLQKNGKTVDDVVNINKKIVYMKKDEKGVPLPITSEDMKIIDKKISDHLTDYEEKQKKTKTNIPSNTLSSALSINTANAYRQSSFDGITVTTWATDYASGTSYDVRYKIYGVFNWLWDDDGQSHEYDPALTGDDFMTLNWAGDLALETERYAEVEVQEYPWNPNVVYTTNSGYFISLADVEPNGGLGFKFDEKYHVYGAYYAKADSGHMYVYVHKNTAEGEDANFKFTYTHTWTDTDIGYEVQAGYNTAAGTITINNQEDSENFITYDLFPM